MVFDVEKVISDVKFLYDRREFRRCLELIDEELIHHSGEVDLHQFAIKCAGQMGLTQRIVEAYLAMAAIFEERKDVHTAAACYMEAKRFNPGVQSTMRIKKLVERVRGPQVSEAVLQAKTQEAEKTETPSMQCDLAVVHWVDAAQVLAVKRSTGVLVVKTEAFRVELHLDYGYLVAIQRPEPVENDHQKMVEALKDLYVAVDGGCEFYLRQQVVKDFPEQSIEGLLMDVAASLDVDNRDGGESGWGSWEEDEPEAETSVAASTQSSEEIAPQASAPVPAVPVSTAPNGFYFGQTNDDVLEI